MFERPIAYGSRARLAALQVAFKDLVEGLSARSADEKATVASLRNKFGRYNPKGCLPISLRVLGATVGTDSDLAGHYTFKITDAKASCSLAALAFEPCRWGSRAAWGGARALLRRASCASAPSSRPGCRLD